MYDKINTNNKIKGASIIVWIVAGIIGSITLISLLPDTFTDFGSKPPVISIFDFQTEDLRFQKVETFMFEKANYPSNAIIYEDTETGVRYLYIWQGAMKSACITRLWEK